MDAVANGGRAAPDLRNYFPHELLFPVLFSSAYLNITKLAPALFFFSDMFFFLSFLCCDGRTDFLPTYRAWRPHYDIFALALSHSQSDSLFQYNQWMRGQEKTRQRCNKSRSDPCHTSKVHF